MQRRLYIVFLSLILVLGVLATLYPYLTAPKNPLSVLDSCFTKASPEDVPDIACLRREVKKIVELYPTKEIMQRFESKETSETTQRNCHFISHFVGEFTVKKTGNLEGALAQCTNACRFGCPHGAIGSFIVQEVGGDIADQEFVHENKEALWELGKKYCAVSNELCHGVGHIFYIAMQDYDEALKSCDTIPRRFQNCFAGVLMEGAGHVDSLWIGTSTIVARTHTDDYSYPCLTLKPRYQNACFRYLPGYQHARFLENEVTDVEEQVRISQDICEAQKASTRSDCFYGLGNYAYRLVNAPGSTISVRTFCDRFVTETDRTACSVGVVRAYITDENKNSLQALSYCSAISEEGRKETCYLSAFYMDEHYSEKTLPENVCSIRNRAECVLFLKKYEVEKDSLPDYLFGI